MVAKKVSGSHTASACQKKYTQVITTPRRKKKLTNSTISDPLIGGPDPIPSGNTESSCNTESSRMGGPGTIKRKRESDVVEILVEGHSDDVFQSTPFKKKRQVIYLLPVEVEVSRLIINA